MSVRTIAGLVLFAAAASRGASAGTPEQTADEIAEAVFRQQLDLWLDDNERDSHTVLCLAIEESGVAKSVSREFLQRFKREPAVRGRGECEARKDGAVESATGRPAILVTVGAIQWLNADEARVKVHHFRSQVLSASRTYRVVREQSRWICLGQVIDLAPA